jgi:hypothetical protein
LHMLAAGEAVRVLYDQPLQSRIVQLPLQNGLNADNDVDCSWRGDFTGRIARPL